MSESITTAVNMKEPSQEPSGINFGELRQILAPFAIFLGLLLIISLSVPEFLGGGGPSIIAQQAAPILLVALSQCIVLQIGSIDLSNAALGLFCAILTALTLGPLGIGSPFLCVAIVTGIGLINGLLIVSTQAPSFALTLGMLGVLQAASLHITGSSVVYVTENLAVVSWLYEVQFLTLPVAFWISVGLAIALWAVLRFTIAGQGFSAIGFNERASILSGLPVKWLKIAAFGLSGFFAGLAGLCVIAIGGAASSIGLGSDLLVPGIAAALVGGTAITGGVCNPINVVFGAMFIALIPVGTAAIGISPQSQSTVYGLVLIIAVALTASHARGGIVK
jgi:ribose transport system permease protein